MAKFRRVLLPLSFLLMFASVCSAQVRSAPWKISLQRISLNPSGTNLFNGRWTSRTRRHTAAGSDGTSQPLQDGAVLLATPTSRSGNGASGLRDGLGDLTIGTHGIHDIQFRAQPRRPSSLSE
jgi:hypothetical protein